MCTVVLNNKLNGVELSFENKPATAILNLIKESGYRWHNVKKIWYAKQNEKTLAVAEQLKDDNSEQLTAIETTVKTATIKQNKKVLSLYDRLQFVEGSTDKSQYHFKYVGSNYTGLDTKETAKLIRQHLKQQFSEVKFSVTSDYNKIWIEIKSSPYDYKKLDYKPELEAWQYREYEKENNKEIKAILNYCEKLLSSYNYDDSDIVTDYFHTHFYTSISVSYGYTQTEQTEEIKTAITTFRKQLEADRVKEEEQKELEYQEYLKKQEQDKIEYEKRVAEEKKQREIVCNNVTITELDETQQYYIINSEFAKLNKNNTLTEYKEEVEKGEFNLEDIKITRELHFSNTEALEHFNNMLLHDFDFLEGTGGSNTDDLRINSMTDYYNMTEEEQKTVKWYLKGVAVYCDNKLQFVIDTQGHSYARYIGLTDNSIRQNKLVTIQTMTTEELTILKEQAEILTDYSTEVIDTLNIKDTWNNDNWTEYRKAMTEKLINSTISITKAVIQQLYIEELKEAMYKLLKETDGIQEQFKNAITTEQLKENDKITLVSINSDFGGLSVNRVTYNSIEYKEYAQYTNNVKLTYKPQNKRSLYYNNYHDTLLVYKGWFEIPENVLFDIKDNGICITKSSKFSSCDKGQIDAVMEYMTEQGQKPIINTYKPIF